VILYFVSCSFFVFLVLKFYTTQPVSTRLHAGFKELEINCLFTCGKLIFISINKITSTNIMTFTELLTDIRSAYVDALAKAISVQSANIEPAYRLADGSLATEGTLSLPCRMDLVPKEGEMANQPVMVESSSKLRFEPISFDIQSTTVAVSPFGWDWVTLEARDIKDESAAQTLKEWFLYWFDPDDNNELTAEGLFGVVHFLSDLESTSTGFRVNIDLGSSPAYAFEDLLFRLSDTNVAQLLVS
jgi:hypothetical protein